MFHECVVRTNHDNIVPGDKYLLRHERRVQCMIHLNIETRTWNHCDQALLLESLLPYGVATEHSIQHQFNSE